MNSACLPVYLNSENNMALSRPDAIELLRVGPGTQNNMNHLTPLSGTNVSFSDSVPVSSVILPTLPYLDDRSQNIPQAEITSFLQATPEDTQPKSSSSSSDSAAIKFMVSSNNDTSLNTNSFFYPVSEADILNQIKPAAPEKTTCLQADCTINPTEAPVSNSSDRTCDFTSPDASFKLFSHHFKAEIL